MPTSVIETRHDLKARVMTRPIPKILLFLSKHLKAHRLQVSLNIIVGSALVALDLSFVWASKLAIDIATHATRFATLKQAFVLIACIMLVRITLVVLSRWIRSLLGVKAQNSMRIKVFSHLLRCRWEEMKKYHTGNLTNRLERDVTDIVNFITESVPSFVTTSLQFIGAFLFLFFMDSTLACIVVLVIPFFLISSKLYFKKMRKLTHDVRDDESRIQSTLQETLGHAMVVKTMRRVEHFIGQLSGQQKQLHGRVLTRTKYSSVSAGLLSIGFATGYFIAFAWGTVSLQRGLISYGALLAFIQLVGQIQLPVRNLSRFIPIFITSFTAAERLMDVEDIELEDQTEPIELQGPLSIRLEGVTFAYGEGSRKIFSQFDHTFKAGSVTAIMGETGAGKTTLIRLLLSLVRPLEGRIMVIDANKQPHLSSPALRGNFAYVPQGNSLFSGTIRTNLWLGNPQATDDEMREALHLAAADFVFQKSKGLDTPCGESGDGLSEGQAQRIAIARALLSKGQIYIFDEATSSLDAQTEKTVLKNIIEARPNATHIFITHRQEVLRYADQTISLDYKHKLV